MQGVGRTAGCLLAALAALGAAQAAAKPSKPAVHTDQAEILKAFPSQVEPMTHGVRLRLTTGAWAEVVDSPFAPSAAPVLCWYAPSLNVAGVCQLIPPDLNITAVINLRNGRRISLPGHLALSPEPGLLTVGADPKDRADSMSLVRVSADDVFEEGDVSFDEGVGPAGWAGPGCFRLNTKAGKAWLEKRGRRWLQVSPARSKVCQKRYGG